MKSREKQEDIVGKYGEITATKYLDGEDNRQKHCVETHVLAVINTEAHYHDVTSFRFCTNPRRLSLPARRPMGLCPKWGITSKFFRFIHLCARSDVRISEDLIGRGRRQHRSVFHETICNEPSRDETLSTGNFFSRTMPLIKWPTVPSEFQSCQHIIYTGPKIMDLSDSMSSASSSSSPQAQTKIGARRGRPRLTEDAELAKLV